MRFTQDQLRDAWVHVRDAQEQLMKARIFYTCEWGIHSRMHGQIAIDQLRTAARTLGYSFEPLPVTDKPGFDGRDDRSLGMKEADIT